MTTCSKCGGLRAAEQYEVIAGTPCKCPLPLSHTLYGGKSGDEYNALRSALSTAATLAGHTGEYAEYEWLDQVPRTSMIIELVDALHRHGYEIKQINN